MRSKALRKKSRLFTVEEEPEDVQALEASQEKLAVKENPSQRSPSPAPYESIFTKGTSKTETPRKVVTSNPSMLIFTDKTTHKNDNNNMFPRPAPMKIQVMFPGCGDGWSLLSRRLLYYSTEIVPLGLLLQRGTMDQTYGAWLGLQLAEFMHQENWSGGCWGMDDIYFPQVQTYAMTPTGAVELLEPITNKRIFRCVNEVEC